MPPSESGGSGGTRLTLSKRFAHSQRTACPSGSRDIHERWRNGVFLDPTKTGLSSPRKRGDEPRSAAASQRGRVIVPDTVAGAFACSTAQSRA